MADEKTTPPKRGPIRFGAKGRTAGSASEWRSIARRAEDLGYASFHVDDHLDDQLGLVPAITAAADATSTILVGPLVAGVDFRNPAVFAKECATIDLLSEGRLILGLGAGWLDRDYAAAGLQQDPAGVRIERLGEAVEILRGLWAQEPFTFKGEHFRLEQVDGRPKPVGSIPIVVGGGGPKVLRLAAKVADIVGINPRIVKRSMNPRTMATFAMDQVGERVEWVRAAAGDERFASLDLQMQIFGAAITDDPRGAASRIASARGVDEELVASSPYFQFGSAKQIAENLREVNERFGFNYFTFGQDATEPMAPVVSMLAGK